MFEDLTVKETAILGCLILSKVKPISREQIFQMSSVFLKGIHFTEEEFDKIFQNFVVHYFRIERNKVQGKS